VSGMTAEKERDRRAGEAHVELESTERPIHARWYGDVLHQVSLIRHIEPLAHGMRGARPKRILLLPGSVASACQKWVSCVATPNRTAPVRAQAILREVRPVLGSAAWNCAELRYD